LIILASDNYSRENGPTKKKELLRRKKKTGEKRKGRDQRGAEDRVKRAS